MKGLRMKGLNFSKRSIARYVDEGGRRLKGFYPALREYTHSVVLRNRIDLAAFALTAHLRSGKNTHPKNWSERSTGTVANASNSGFAPVRTSRPAPTRPSVEERIAQSKRDREACLRSKRRKRIAVGRAFLEGLSA